MKERGLVIKSTGKWYEVKIDNGEVIPCVIRGKFRLEGKKLTNPVAVGDTVVIEMESGEERVGTIVEIGDRHNYLVRQSPRKKHALHLMASNVDQALLITTLIEPQLKPGFIDRFLLITEGHNIPVIIVINKSDLFDEVLKQEFQALKGMYEKIGYTTMAVSALRKQGLEPLQQRLKDRTTFVAGQSGVGKSSLLNALCPELDLKTQILSRTSGKGLHTTTFAEMYFLPGGGRIIDSPGIKNLSFNNMSVQDVAHNFREFFERSSECRFSDCTHRNEPHCAVKAAVEEGEIAPLRYQNYLQILQEIEQQNSWERLDY